MGFIRWLAIVWAVTSISCTPYFDHPSTLYSQIGLKSPLTIEQSKNHEAIILLDDEIGKLQLSVDGVPRFVKRVHRVMQVFRNFDDYSTLELPYSSEDRITDISARTISRNGSLHVVKPSEG